VSCCPCVIQMANVKIGVKLTAELEQTFSKINIDGGNRFLKVVLNDSASEFIKVCEGEVVGSWESDFDTVLSVLEPKKACLILYRTDKKSDNHFYWYILGYVPDDGPVRQKLTYAAARHNLSQELGAANFIDYIHGTHKEEFGAEGFRKYYESKTSEVPLSEQEKQRKEEREIEITTVAEFVKSFPSSQGAGQSNVTFSADSNVSDAFKSMHTGQVNYIRLSIDNSSETIKLENSSTVSLTELPQQVPKKDCSFHFFNWNHVHEGQSFNSIIFVFCTPDGTHGTSSAPVKSRMVYAASKQHVLQLASNCGLEVPTRLEVGSGQELTESEFSEILHPKTQTESSTFKKTSGPKGRKPK